MPLWFPFVRRLDKNKRILRINQIILDLDNLKKWISKGKYSHAWNLALFLKSQIERSMGVKSTPEDIISNDEIRKLAFAKGRLLIIIENLELALKEKPLPRNTRNAINEAKEILSNILREFYSD